MATASATIAELGNPKASMNTYAFDDSWFYAAPHGTLCSGPILLVDQATLRSQNAGSGALDHPRLRHPSLRPHRTQLLLSVPDTSSGI